eukprot:5149558-Prymnesium_polylepis.1
MYRMIASQPASQPARDPRAGSAVSGRLRLLHPLQAVEEEEEHDTLLLLLLQAVRVRMRGGPETRQANSLRITAPQASHMHTCTLTQTIRGHGGSAAYTM